MNDLREQREEIVRGLEEINRKLTDEIIQSATKEEMEEYIELIDEITARLATIDMLLEENN